jgi:hypothetical protein
MNYLEKITGSAIEEAKIVSELLTDEKRAAFISQHFGDNKILFFRAVFTIMRSISPTYHDVAERWHWNIYQLSNGGFYMAPCFDSGFEIIIPYGNNWEGKVSADAAGIIVTMMALSHLSFEDIESIDFAEHYHQLRDFMCTHIEASDIFGAID